MDETKTLISTPDAGTVLGLSCYVGARSAATSPNAMKQWAVVPSTGMSAAAHPAQVAFGARTASLPGLPPRGAPV